MLMKLISLSGSLGWRSSIDLARRDWLEARKLPTTRLTLRTDFILNRNLNYSGGKTCAILNDCAAEWFNFSPFLLWIFNDALTYFPLLRFSPLHATAKRFANLKNSNFNELHFPRTLESEAASDMKLSDRESDLNFVHLKVAFHCMCSCICAIPTLFCCPSHRC